MASDDNPRQGDVQSEPLRNALESEWLELGEKADELINLGNEVLKFGTQLSKEAELSLRAVAVASPYANWEEAIEAARRLNRTLNPTELRTEWVSLNSATGASGTVATTQAYELLSYRTLGSLPTYREIEIEKVAHEFENFFEQDGHRTEIIVLMQGLGFERTKQGLTASQKYIGAWELHYHRVESPDPYTWAPLSLREAIDITISELLMRRRKQNETRPKQKLIDIGRDLGYDTVESSVFSDLQQVYAVLHEEMSKKKDKITGSREATELMNRGTQFLRALLSTIDPQKIRSSQ